MVGDRPTPLGLGSSATIGLLTAGAFFIGTDVFVIAGILPQVASSLHVSTAAAGQLMTVFAVSYAVLGPLLSRTVGRTAPQTVLCVALAAVAAGNVVTLCSGTLGMAMLGRALTAAGASQFTPRAAVLVVGLVPPERQGNALANLTKGLAAGSALGVPLGTWASEYLGWRPVLAVLAAGTAAVAAVWASSLSGAGHAAPGATGTAPRFVELRSATVGLVLLITLLAVIAEYATYTYVSAVFGRLVGSSAGSRSVLLLAFGVGGILGSMLAARLLDTRHGRHIVPAAMATMCLCFAVMIWSSHWWPAAIAVMAIWGVAGWAYAAPQQHRLLRHAGGAGSLAVSLNGSLIYTGAALGAGLGGVLLHAGSVAGLTTAAALLCAVALAVNQLLPRPAEPAVAVPADAEGRS